MITPVVKECQSCRVFAGEVQTPIGDGAALLCWLCAHDATCHDMELGTISAGCSCSSSEIYPAHVLAKRVAAPSRARTITSDERPAAALSGRTAMPAIPERPFIRLPEVDAKRSAAIAQGMRRARVIRRNGVS